MAELPPRAPTMADRDLAWPDFQPPATAAAPNMALDQPNVGTFDSTPSWIQDDFVEFSEAKRRAHRETAVGFRGPPGGGGEFEDDAQLIMSMFNNEPIKEASDGPTNSWTSGPASSSGNGSTNHEKRSRRGKPPGVKTEHEEVESATCKNDECRPDTHGAPPVSPPPLAAGSHETVSDPKRVKRILANRQSARRSRVRKLQYISELERNLTTLQREVSMLSPRVAYLDHQRMILSDDNSTLKTKIAALAQDNIFKDAHQEALKREIERLKQVYQQQHNITTTPISSPPPSAQAPAPT